MRAGSLARSVLAACALLAGVNEAAARYEGDLNLFAGQKWLNAGDWEPVERQPQFGLMLAFGEERAAVHFVLDAFVASKDASEPAATSGALVSGSSTEVAIGVRKVWIRGATRPHLGAGANVVSVSEDRLNGVSGTVTNDDRGYGVWVDTGVTWRLASHLNLGFELRYSSERVELGSGSVPRDAAAGGFHLGLLVGYGW